MDDNNKSDNNNKLDDDAKSVLKAIVIRYAALAAVGALSYLAMKSCSSSVQGVQDKEKKLGEILYFQKEETTASAGLRSENCCLDMLRSGEDYFPNLCDYNFLNFCGYDNLKIR